MCLSVWTIEADAGLGQYSSSNLFIQRERLRDVGFAIRKVFLFLPQVLKEKSMNGYCRWSPLVSL